MTPDVIVVDHHDSYTWNLVHLIAGVTGVVPEVVEHDEPDAREALDDATHVVLSPGPGRPDDVRDFALGPDVFHLGIPVLGVCLGMQALVTAYGGTVARSAPAHGVVSRIRHDGAGLFVGLPQGFDAVRYHSLAATHVPEPLVVTAESDGVVMGVRHPTLPLEEVQFHPESVLSAHGIAIIATFLGLPARQPAVQPPAAR